MALQSINPATGELVREYEEMSSADVGAIVARAARAQEEWARTSFAERAAALRAMAEALTRRKDELAELAAIEMGKPLREGRSEVDKCAKGCLHFAEHAERFLLPERE